jgi:hypothetical protein
MASAPKIPRFPRRLLAKIREPGYTHTGQQDTDAILQDEVTRTRYCPRQLRMSSQAPRDGRTAPAGKRQVMLIANGNCHAGQPWKEIHDRLPEIPRDSCRVYGRSASVIP